MATGLEAQATPPPDLGTGEASSLESPILEVPAFFVESLRVEGQRRATEDILLAEARLEPGRPIAETELRAAVARLVRLPFVLGAGFRLEKGTERGRYVLVLEIEETRRFFFGETLTRTRTTGDLVSLGRDVGSRNLMSASPLAGVRFFPGRRDELFLGVAAERGVQAGWTRYGLFGRGASLSLGLSGSSSVGPSQIFGLGLAPNFVSWSSSGSFYEAQGLLTLPLERDRSLRVTARVSRSSEGTRQAVLDDALPDPFGGEATGDVSFGIGDFLPGARRFFGYRDLQYRMLGVGWVDDTTDDPIFPSRGRAFGVWLEAQEIGVDLSVPDIPQFGPFEPLALPPGLAPGDQLPRTRSRQVRAVASAAHHLPRGRRQTFSASARLAFGLSWIDGMPLVVPQERGCESDSSGCLDRLIVLEGETPLVWESAFRLRHTVRLSSREWSRKRADIRLETTLDIGADGLLSGRETLEQLLARQSAGVALVVRNRWGLFRFGFQVVDYRSER